MDRCVVLVDAGYLLGAAASLLAGEPSRSRITVDHAAVVAGLRERAELETGQPLLRIYWFDGAPDRVPQPEHRRLRVMPRVTVRLGALTRTDGRWAQKGVDAAMHAELSELARNRACSDVVLVTGDGAAKGVPTPKDLAGLGRVQQAPVPHPVPNATLRWSSDKTWSERGPGNGPDVPDTSGLPTLAQLTSAEQRWADREADITAVSGDPFEVGQVFARRWIARLTDAAHLQALSTHYPRVPHRIDGELLRYAARFGLLAHKDDQIDEHDRYAIRAGFWREVDARTVAEHAPAGD
ncbi:NYN domain-containing protein [Streptomyces sp. So13.3]|uniref:NYN domain-containing protein n=1 Tax=Streptomyces sp. So13.3 TaxID=2136173 RepID=UPI00164CFD42|nr:NYN domain-containing protein [Streptomyces sp. So13.3]QNA72893.1 NYN domain-containing protein [Streptomyces sp. So13.3]